MIDRDQLFEHFREFYKISFPLYLLQYNQQRPFSNVSKSLSQFFNEIYANQMRIKQKQLTQNDRYNNLNLTSSQDQQISPLTSNLSTKKFVHKLPSISLSKQLDTESMQATKDSMSNSLANFQELGKGQHQRLLSQVLSLNHQIAVKQGEIATSTNQNPYQHTEILNMNRSRSHIQTDRYQPPNVDLGKTGRFPVELIQAADEGKKCHKTLASHKKLLQPIAVVQNSIHEEPSCQQQGAAMLQQKEGNQLLPVQSVNGPKQIPAQQNLSGNNSNSILLSRKQMAINQQKKLNKENNQNIFNNTSQQPFFKDGKQKYASKKAANPVSLKNANLANGVQKSQMLDPLRVNCLNQNIRPNRRISMDSRNNFKNKMNLIKNMNQLYPKANQIVS